MSSTRTEWLCSTVRPDSPDEDAHVVPATEQAHHVPARDCTCVPRLLCRTCLSFSCSIHEGRGRIVSHNEAS